MAISEDLELDVSKALASVSQLEQAIAAAVGGAASDAASTIEAALDGIAPPDLTITADAGEVPAAIDAAVADANTDVTVDATATDVTTSIDDAVAAADTSVELTATLDTGDVEGQLADVAGSADVAGGSLLGASQGADVFSAAAGAATGSAAGLEGAMAGLGGPGVAAGAAGLGALALAGRTFFTEALDDQTATERLNRTFGDLAGSVNALDLTTLNTTLDDLTLKLGSADETVRDAAANIGILGQTSGASAPQISETVQEMIALSARAVALNPNLGQVGDVMDRLLIALSRGGRFAASFGLSLAPADINARALSNTLKTNVADLTIYDKATAGAQLATENLGTSLGSDIAAGAQQAVFSVRSVREELRRELEAVGSPLIQPILAALQSAEPVAVELGRDMGLLLQAILPVAAALVSDLEPAVRDGGEVLRLLLAVLQPVLDLIASIPAPAIAAAAGFVAANKAVGLLANGVAALGKINLAGTIAGSATGVGLAVAAVVGLTTVLHAHSQAKQEAKQRSEEFQAAIEADTKALQEQNGALAENVQKLVEKKLADRNQLDDLNRAGVSEELFTKAIEGNRDAQEEVIGKLREHGELNFGLALTIKQLTSAYGSATTSLDELATFQGTATDAAADQAKANAELAAQLRTVQTELDKATASGAAVADLTRRLRDGTITTEQLTEAMIALGDKAPDVFRALGQQIDSFTSSLLAAVPSQGEVLFGVVDDITASLAKLDDPKVTKAASDLQDKLRDLEQQTADDLRDFDRSVQASLDSLAAGFAQKIPGAAEAFQTAMTSIDAALEAERKRQSTLAADFRTDLEQPITLPDITASFQEQTKAITAFFDEVRALTAAGLNDTAQLLLQLGPQAGAALATSLAGATDQQRQDFETSAEGLAAAGGQGVQAINDVLATLPATVATQAEAARRAFEDKFKIAEPANAQLEQIRADFSRQLDLVAADARTKAEKAAANIGEGLATVKDRAADAFSLDDVLRGLEGQTGDVGRFYDNVQSLVDKHLDGIAALLLEKGPQAAGHLAELLAGADQQSLDAFERQLDAYGAQEDRGVALAAQTGTRMHDALARALSDTTNVAAAGRLQADAFVQALTKQLGPLAPLFPDLTNVPHVQPPIPGAPPAVPLPPPDPGAVIPGFDVATRGKPLSRLGGVNIEHLEIVQGPAPVATGDAVVRALEDVTFRAASS